MSRTTRIRMTSQRQEAQLVGAIQEVFVGEFGWLGHHGPWILP
ncbi:hypothetical protein [Variovorax sp. HW608]|nr:hypothetical protein [Variovorax sp. HW608]